MEDVLMLDKILLKIGPHWSSQLRDIVIAKCVLSWLFEFLKILCNSKWLEN